MNMFRGAIKIDIVLAHLLPEKLYWSRTTTDGFLGLLADLFGMQVDKGSTVNNESNTSPWHHEP